jgi:hypothetical protein
MKAMVLLARRGRRLRRAAVVGGLGAAAGESERRAGADPVQAAAGESERPAGADRVHEQQQDVGPDADVTSRDELDPGQHELRPG